MNIFPHDDSRYFSFVRQSGIRSYHLKQPRRMNIPLCVAIALVAVAVLVVAL